MKYGDIQNGRDCLEATKWSRMAPCGAWGPKGSNPLDGDMWLNNPIWAPCAICHCSRPHRRMRTIPGVVDIYILHSPRSATRMLRQKSTWRSRVSSSELVQSQCARSYRAHLSSREIAMSTSDAASEWRSMESEVWRYPQRPGSSSFDDVVENGDIWCMGSRWGY